MKLTTIAFLAVPAVAIAAAFTDVAAPAPHTAACEVAAKPTQGHPGWKGQKGHVMYYGSLSARCDGDKNLQSFRMDQQFAVHQGLTAEAAKGDQFVFEIKGSDIVRASRRNQTELLDEAGWVSALAALKRVHDMDVAFARPIPKFRVGYECASFELKSLLEGSRFEMPVDGYYMPHKDGRECDATTVFQVVADARQEIELASRTRVAAATATGWETTSVELAPQITKAPAKAVSQPRLQPKLSAEQVIQAAMKAEAARKRAPNPWLTTSVTKL